jgi:hypothetical protein
MSAAPWNVLCEQLSGFHEVLHFEFSCPCGDWRSAMSADSKCDRLRCPRCGETHRAFVLGRGLTRSTVAWVMVSPSLTRNRNVRLCRPRTGRPKAREVTARVLRTVNLMVQGKTAPEIARELRLSSSHYNLFLRRRKTDIDAELRRITINSCAQGARGGANRNSVCHAI